MTTKKTIKKVLNETSSSPLKTARKEDGETRAVASTNANGAADNLPDAAPAADAPAADPIPNVQSEPDHGSVAAEDTRDAEVAEPGA